MHILLYVPDNQVTRNFVPHLWPFLLQRITPKQHHVTIIDGNAQRYSAADLVDFILQNEVDLVGMGFMTRMAQTAYRMALAIRAGTGVPVVMGGPHVTEVPDEPLGRTGLPQCADAVVLGEADDLWPVVVRDAELKQLQNVYQPAVVAGRDVKPSLKDYPVVAWDELDLTLFNLMRFIPNPVRGLLQRLGVNYDNLYVIPIESGRGCPYGCEFCTVTGFFGDQIRFRDNENVIAELQRLKAMAKKNNALVIVCFIDDNFAINTKRTKSLLRDMIQHDVCFPFWSQISMNLLRDEELVRLLAASGGRWVLMGLESLNTESLKVANKSFNKPDEYATILNSMAKHDIYAMNSFIFGMEGDRPGVARATMGVMDGWPPGLPIFGILTPYPATPLYDRLQKEGRLTRPQHWLDFQAFKPAFLPRLMSPDDAVAEVHVAWSHSYETAAFRRAQKWLLENEKPFRQQLTFFVARLFFRGIYFRQMTGWSWVKLLARNSRTIGSLLRSGWADRRKKNGNNWLAQSNA